MFEKHKREKNIDVIYIDEYIKMSNIIVRDSTNDNVSDQRYNVMKKEFDRFCQYASILSFHSYAGSYMPGAQLINQLLLYFT